MTDIPRDNIDTIRQTIIEQFSFWRIPFVRAGIEEIYFWLEFAESPNLAAAEPIEVAWTGKPPKPAWNWWSPKNNNLVTQWRRTPDILRGRA